MFHKIEANGTYPNLFNEVSITLILKPDKYTIRRKGTHLFLIYIGAKIIGKILTN